MRLATFFALSGLAVVATLSAASAEEPALPSAAQVLERTVSAYVQASNDEDVRSIEIWCRDSLRASHFERDNFILSRGVALGEEASKALLMIYAKLDIIEEAEADLLCPKGALQ